MQNMVGSDTTCNISNYSQSNEQLAGWNAKFTKVIYYDGSSANDRSILYSANPALSAAANDTGNKAQVFPKQAGMFMSNIYVSIVDRDI